MAKIDAIDNINAPLDQPVVRKIGIADLKQSLLEGLDDFKAMPTHALFIVLIYPVIGLFLARYSFGSKVLPLLFPLMAGFGLLGPFAALGLYELSRQRERGEVFSWTTASNVLKGPSLGAIVALGVWLLAIFLVWMGTAQAIYKAAFGNKHVPESVSMFLQEIFLTPQGWTVIIVGNLVGIVFSAVVLAISVVSFPMLIDRPVSLGTAIQTSIRAVMANPGPMVVWALIVAVGLFIGFVPVFFGLAVTLPILGHSTWHLYRKLVAP
ncbi:DUF2189 domain-containing protein [Microvirga terricola]|uniref:DUF2189 domain-containing protein n=1 Tax=Microvirga terricola TaxID=2719797 RepID=A0ABX0V8Y7_9HYPH|nr:DUF2189 domain-containing protein [Microvirga terricola]NIX75716.1 DUF2189 domain-containing protein [Microvirga terricola]